MNWTFAIQQKLKVALLLGSIMILVIIFALIEKQNIKNIHRGFSSIYSDRLVPAIDLFYINENIYKKNIILSSLVIDSTKDTQTAQYSLSVFNHNIDSLINDYEKTYLISKETEHFVNLKSVLKELIILESSVFDLLRLQQAKAASDLYALNNPVLQIRISEQMGALIKIQSAVGSELLEDSKNIESRSHFLSTLQIIIAIVIGMMVQVLVFASRITNKKNDKYRLN